MKQLRQKYPARSEERKIIQIGVASIDVSHITSGQAELATVTSDAAAQPEQRTPTNLWTDSQLYDLAPMGFLTLDRRARIIELNRKAASLLGSVPNRLRNRPFLVFVAKDDVFRFVRFLRDSVRTAGLHVIHVDLVVEARHVPVQISLVTILDETIIHELAMVDLTEIKKTENLLQESLAHWHSLVQNAPDVIMSLEDSGKIAFVNASLWGYSVKSLIGANILNYVSRREKIKLQRCLRYVFQSETRTECEIKRADGNRQLWFTFSFGPAKRAAARGLTTVLIRDISEQKRSEKILRASSKQLRDFAARMDAVREEERMRLAREIHDELGQALTILKLDLSWVYGQLRSSHPGLRKKMKSMISEVDDTIGRVRRISSELRPSILDDLGLGPAIEWQVSEFQKRTGIRAQILSDAERADLPQEAAAATFRVVQEALTNVIRHAEATRVRVGLLSEDHRLKISIEDNGKGMTEGQMKNTKSLGIVGMKERVARLGGEFNIFSEPGKGTRLDITIPAHHD